PEHALGAVPPVLMSGNHAAIARWRRTQQLLRTRSRRPELFAAVTLSKADRKLLAAADAEPATPAVDPPDTAG
ncbi:MAG: tRNA (guanosine(37)-N1)-methyltransferase TrmD, partial [Xanthomonadales bacterium]|nr:tRNA (guanosine(37)-N1)-methyltransferase TrmD [Xanthomonadales bacterium]